MLMNATLLLTLGDMQHMGSFLMADSTLDLMISQKKKPTVMYQPHLDKACSKPSIDVYGQKLQVVEKVIYLGTTVNDILFMITSPSK